MPKQLTIMKTVKLSILKNQKSQLKLYSVIKVEVNCKIDENAIELGNLIRRKLLKDTVWLKIPAIKGKNWKRRNLNIIMQQIKLNSAKTFHII